MREDTNVDQQIAKRNVPSGHVIEQINQADQSVTNDFIQLQSNVYKLNLFIPFGLGLHNTVSVRTPQHRFALAFVQFELLLVI